MPQFRPQPSEVRAFSGTRGTRRQVWSVDFDGGVCAWAVTGAHERLWTAAIPTGELMNRPARPSYRTLKYTQTSDVGIAGVLRASASRASGCVCVWVCVYVYRVLRIVRVQRACECLCTRAPFSGRVQSTREYPVSTPEYPLQPH
jgi:hypothetical protein